MKYFIPILFIFCSFVKSDEKTEFIELKWNTAQVTTGDQIFKKILTFEGADYSVSEPFLPVYTKDFQLNAGETDFEVLLEEPVFRQFDKKDIPENQFLHLPGQIEIKKSIVKSGSEKWLRVSILPVKSDHGSLFFLEKFSLKGIPVKTAVAEENVFLWKTESVLKSGTWIKIKTSGKGIYKIPLSKLADWGISQPSKASVFGSGGKILSEDPGTITYDDLEQTAAWFGKSNGVDCLFFYEQGTVEWKPGTTGYFSHRNNPWSNAGYFFITDSYPQKSVGTAAETTSQPTNTVTSFNEYALYEVDTVNLISSGKQWFGEHFLPATSRNFSFAMKNADESSDANLVVNAAARSKAGTTMKITINQSVAGNLTFQGVTTTDPTSQFAFETSLPFKFKPSGTSTTVNLQHNSSFESSEAWLDFIELNYRRKLKIDNDVLFFRDLNSSGAGKTAEYTIENCNASVKILDVTNSQDIKEMKVSISGNTGKMAASSTELHEFAAFNPDAVFPEPQFVEKVENQNLHKLDTPEYLIIANPAFLNPANKLADFHRTNSNLKVEVVNVNTVFNEFSSGNKDATGIRNFIKMFYDRGNTLKYVLLLGDGSFDNKNILKKNKAFIPTFQSDNSLDPISSFVTDDYYVLLDKGESVYNGVVDLGIGRIPASNLYEADLVVGKILGYYSPSALGTWRNTVCFIGDDGDYKLHMNDSEELADIVNASHKEFVTEKIYFDAYKKEISSGGGKYPDVTNAINEKVNDGVLILNYVGHANHMFLADEKVLDISTINSWSNENNLPIFVTATCEFSRFDASETSAGEYILFNPSGGGIGLFSTTRVVFAYSNSLLSKNFYQFVFQKDNNGNHYRMGDIMRLAKVNTINTINQRNFTLLADPALMLSYPEYRVNTETINQKNANLTPDTVGAMQKVTVTGFISDHKGNRLNTFNGTITPIVYDKMSLMKTLGNEGAEPMEFKVQENILYKGLAKVNNGNFTFSFMVPRDITYNTGHGKIIYYAENGKTDANGAFENFIIGGNSKPGITDNKGPELKLYMDSTNFVNGGKTSKNPTLIVLLSDENGINTVGAGIGHDITATIDNNNSGILVLNKYYKSDIGDYTRGSIRIPLSGLSEGLHVIKVKAWDVANNSTVSEISFYVNGSFSIESVSSYPNPVSSYTFFTFDHNHSGATLNALIEIFDLSGRRIDYIKSEVGSNGLRSNPVRWDIGSSGKRPGSGIYVYRITAKTSDGLISMKSGKLSIVY